MNILVSSRGAFNWRIVIAAFIVFLCISGFAAYINTAGKIRQQSQIANRLVEVINDFHDDIAQIPASSTDKEALSEKLQTVKTVCEQSRKKVSNLSSQAIALGPSAYQLQNALAKSENYFIRYGELAAQKIDAKVATASAEEMISNLGSIKDTARIVDCPDSSDTTDALNVCCKLVSNFQKASHPIAVSGSGRAAPDSNNRYWSNPSYGNYHNAIRDVVAEYNRGRAILNRVLDHYDRGILTTSDRTNWGNELVRRRYLIERLQRIYGNIPPGSIYEEHHYKLRQMLVDAVEVMEDFQEHESSYNRSRITSVSRRNSSILSTIKHFYGIR